ncbi:MAG: ABC transporter ATP-binding protein [Candidatus Paceibacterota bacterium]
MIKLDSISKFYYLENGKSSVFYFIKNLFSKDKKENYIALKNISFELKDGEVFGLIGKNGSGKSTLLKIIAGILKPNEGQVNVEGSVVYLSGFYHGMNKNLSMKDNIYIIGTLNGLNKKEISNRMHSIIDFSELSDFVDVPLYKFSTGMMARFSFATTLFTLPQSPDVLLIDEALGGGLDNSFKEKTIKKIKEYIDSAKIVIIASHNYKYILNNCSKTLWMDNGQVKNIGNTKEIIDEYQKFIQ